MKLFRRRNVLCFRVVPLLFVICILYMLYGGYFEKRHGYYTEWIIEKYSELALENYYCYPCVEHPKLNDMQPCVRTIRIDGACDYKVRCTELTLKNINNMSICAHDPEQSLISRRIIDEDGWEDRLVLDMISILQQTPDMMVFDVGCNIGVFTLAAASMSRRVVCVDAFYENLHLVHRTLSHKNLAENVTLVWNALSFERGIGNLSIVEGVIGMSTFEKSHLVGYQTIAREVPVQFIQLDELQLLARGKTVFMKMDVEYFELQVLNGGMQFLKNINVRYIQMEFNNYATRLDITKLLDVYGFLLYKDAGGQQWIPIDEVPKLKRQRDVYFIKRK